MSIDPDMHVGQQRIAQVFRYLTALNELHNPLRRLMREQLWYHPLGNLPSHPAIAITNHLTAVLQGVDSSEISDGLDLDYILRIKRPRLTEVPAPPPELGMWLVPGWKEIDGTVRFHAQRTNQENVQQTVVRFEDDPMRPKLLQEWSLRREQWVRSEKPARDAYKLFEQFYELHGRIEREAGKLELVLGDGILNGRGPNGDIHHPILIQRLQLDFDPAGPEFTLSEADYPVELYSALLRDMAVDGRTISRFREDLEQLEVHPLGGMSTTEFLQRLIVQVSSRGEYIVGEPQAIADYPRLGRSPVLILRSRTQGFASALEAISGDLEETRALPPSLLNIVGVSQWTFDESVDDTVATDSGNDDEHVLFSKAANREQLQIAKRLDTYGCVLVQGPPGTGKTHTIANLVGHLLAQGKSILITSHTTKALRVLRDQIVPDLRPLSVSVLGSENDTRKQLEDSVSTIVERLSSGNAQQLEREAITLRDQRLRLIERLRETRQKLLLARYDEYRDIVVAGESYSPVKAARIVAEGIGVHDWIPGPLQPGEPLPLTTGELIELYQTNRAVTLSDESELSKFLPELDQLVEPADFERLIADDSWRPQNESFYWQSVWQESQLEPNERAFDEALQRAIQSVQIFDELSSWMLAAVTAGIKGPTHRATWGNLITDIKSLDDAAAQAEESLIRYAPAISNDESLVDQVRTIDEIVLHLENGGNLGRWTLLTHSTWKRTLDNTIVSGERPRSLEQIRAVQTLLRLNQQREALSSRWERQVTQLGGPSATELGDRPERSCIQFVGSLQNALDWHDSIWTSVQESLTQLGFAWQTFLTLTPPNLDAHGDLLRMRDAVVQHLPRLIDDRKKHLRQRRAVSLLQKLEHQVARSVGDARSAEVVSGLQKAVSDRNADAYQVAYQRLLELVERSQYLSLRRQLLQRLESTGETWAAAIRDRRPPHDQPHLPGDAASAWLWRQLYIELEQRNSVSLDELQRSVAELNSQLQRVTAQLIDRQAWAAQIRQTDLPKQQALMGWLQVVRRIGKGTGKRAPRLRTEARHLMQTCRASVPVWIMPLTSVVENFDPQSTRFDVVIIDEASQSDVMALIALYMARQVVIVGDHEQVSPDAVGQNIDQVQRLIDEQLIGIPNSSLYDGQLSVYDLAMQSFGGVISLLEHFRSVPEIIQFSNHLSYQGRIKPLRDASFVSLKPHTVSYRVESIKTDKDTMSNEAEARAVSSLILAATEQPEYAGKTFGVISMLGDDRSGGHAHFIDTLLRQQLSPREYAERRIVCGNAAQFQGDERDVMFLSVVDTPKENGGPLALRNADRFRKRFNVAASRARDQMWVVHSLNPDIDLKPDDLRLRLIQHAIDPLATARAIEQGEEHVESEFERQVLRRLVSAGFHVRTQWKVGYYRIDLVVEGGGKRLAVECDGDQYHPLEKLQDDMARQAILERLGWTFVRIRGSEFFRDPDRAMTPVFARLESLGIPPEGREPISDTAADVGTELRDRVIRRAAELRQRFDADESLTDSELVNPLEISSLSQKPRTRNADQTLPSPNGQQLADKSILESDQPQRSDGGANQSGVVLEEARPRRRSSELRARATIDSKGSKVPTQQLWSTEPNSDGSNPLNDKLAASIPASPILCLNCRIPCTLQFDEDGPVLRCLQCSVQHGVPYSQVSQALREFNLRCTDCDQPLSIISYTDCKPVIKCYGSGSCRN